MEEPTTWPTSGPEFGRRALLGAAAASAVALVSGCTPSSGRKTGAGGASITTSGSTPTPAGTAATPPWTPGLSTGDVARVSAARIEEAATLQRCRRIVRQYRRLTDQTHTFEVVLAAHVSAFTTMLPTGAPHASARMPALPGSIDAARAEIVGYATQLARQRTRDCNESDSGALAAVFAAAAAAHRSVVAEWATA